MKRGWVVLPMMLGATLAVAEPIRVAVLDFEDKTGLRPDALLGGAIRPGAVADKGIYLLGEQLAGQTNFSLIDRRDFIAQIEQLRPKDMGEKTPTKPSFLHAAQALRADAVLRGTLLTLSTGKQTVNLGGNQSEQTTLSARVALEALDAKDGTVVAMASGVADRNFRQTPQVKTELSENDVVSRVGDALAKALPAVQKALEEQRVARASRPTVKISVKTSADPALVEIDGILVGSSPLDRFEVYKGDHVLAITKPGYQEITKRILLENDAQIESPMFRVQLSADDIKQIVEKMQINVIAPEPVFVVKPLK